jgi:hypothetical protein
MIAGVGLEPNHVWAPCCETWLKFIILIYCEKECFANYKEKFWVWVTPLVGRHVVNESKVGCQVVNKR